MPKFTVISMMTFPHAVMLLEGRPSRKRRLDLKGFAALNVVSHLRYFAESSGGFSAVECA